MVLVKTNSNFQLSSAFSWEKNIPFQVENFHVCCLVEKEFLESLRFHK